MMTIKKAYTLSVILAFFLTIISCDLLLPGSKLKGQVIDAITGLPVSDATVVATMEANIGDGNKSERKKTTSDTNGQFVIKGLSPKHTYTLTVNKEGFSSDSIRENPPANDQTKLIGKKLAIIPKPPIPGVYTYDKGKYFPISEKQALYYALLYGKPGEVANGFAQSSEGRLAAWYVKNENVVSVIQIPRGRPLIIWQKYSENRNEYYDGIAPLFKQEQKIIVGTKCGNTAQAIIPEGWYLGLEKLSIGEYNIYCFAPVQKVFKKSSFDQFRMIKGDDYTVVFLDILPGKYALTVTEMNWDPNSAYRRNDVSFPVAIFEIN